MQSTLSLRKDQHFVLCLRTLTGKRWLMTWKNLKGESVLSFSSMEEMLKTTHIQWMIDFQPLHQLLNGSLQNPFFWKQKYSSTMWRMTSSSLPIFRFLFNLTREERLALRSLKSSKILLEFKIKVLRLLSSVNKILRQLNNDLHYDSLDSDPTLNHFAACIILPSIASGIST